MSKKNTDQETQEQAEQTTPELPYWNFPAQGRSIQAPTAEEALEILENEKKELEAGE